MFNLLSKSYLEKLLFSFGFFSIFLIYLNFNFLSENLHKPILYVVFLFIAFLSLNIDKKFLNFQNSLSNRYFFTIILSLIFLNLLMNFEYDQKYYLGLIGILLCLTSFFIGPNLKKLITFPNLVIVNILIIFFSVVMMLPPNPVSQDLCISMVELFPRVFCASINGYYRGASVFTPEPSYAAIQMFFLLCCNLFYLKKFSNSNYENFVIYIVSFFLLLCLMFIKSKLGIFFTFSVIFFCIIKYFLKKIDFKILFISLLISLLILFSFIGYIYSETIKYSFYPSCNNLIWSLSFRILSYIALTDIHQMVKLNTINVYDVLFNFNAILDKYSKFNGNEIYAKNFDDSYYLTRICNEAIINTIKGANFFFEPHPLVMKMLFKNGIVFALFFTIYVAKNLIFYFEDELYKTLIIVFIVYVLFMQSSFFLIYQGLAYQIYMYKE